MRTHENSASIDLKRVSMLMIVIAGSQETLFKSMDADGDGRIDMKEFMVAVGMS